MLTAICMLDDDIALFMHAFPDADDRELRAHCLSTLLEYEESIGHGRRRRTQGNKTPMAATQRMRMSSPASSYCGT